MHRRRQSGGCGGRRGGREATLRAEFRGAESGHHLILRGARKARVWAAAGAAAAHGSKNELRLLGSNSVGRDKGSRERRATPRRVVRLLLPFIRALKAGPNSSPGAEAGEGPERPRPHSEESGGGAARLR